MEEFIVKGNGNTIIFSKYSMHAIYEWECTVRVLYSVVIFDL